MATTFFLNSTYYSLVLITVPRKCFPMSRHEVPCYNERLPTPDPNCIGDAQGDGGFPPT